MEGEDAGCRTGEGGGMGEVREGERKMHFCQLQEPGRF